MGEFAQLLKKLDPKVSNVYGPYGKAEVLKYEQSDWEETGVAGLALLGTREGTPIIFLVKGNEKVSEKEIRPGDSVQADERDLVILGRDQDGTVITGFRFQQTRDTLAIDKAIKDSKNAGNGHPVPPPVAVPPPVPTPPPISSTPTEGSTPSRDVPPPVPTPGGTVGKPAPPPVPTPGSKVALPPAVPTPGSTAGRQPSVPPKVPPPVPTPGSNVGATSRAPSVAKSGVPPPVPTPTGQGVFPSTPRSPTIFNTSPSTTHQQAAQQQQQGVFASPPPVKPVANPPRGPSQQVQRQRSEQPTELAAGLCISPPTYGPNGWQTGPDINHLRLAVIKAAMSDSTSVASLQAMLDAWNNN